jgi:hypothetical protein
MQEYRHRTVGSTRPMYFTAAEGHELNEMSDKSAFEVRKSLDDGLGTIFKRNGVLLADLAITSTSLTRVCTFPFGPYQTCDRFWQPTTAIRLLLEQRVAPPPHVSAVPYTPALSYCRNSGFHCSTPFLKGFLTPANACAWSRL